jgi:peptidoglycan/xylan/chitin deacetylase (PgdA/CDA1 family)
MTTGNRQPDRLTRGSVRTVLALLAAVLLTAGCAGPQAPRAPAVGNARPMVSFVFDDGNDTDLLVGREVFAAAGAVASSAVTSGFLGRPGYLTPAQARLLQDAGWEIMGHTVSHPNLASLSPPEVDRELARSRDELESHGLRVANLVYPYNKHDAVVRATAARYYRSGRGGGSLSNGPGLDPYAIASYAVKHDRQRWQALIDTAHAEGRWLVFYQHEIDAKVKVVDLEGDFLPGERLELSPSGTVGRYTTVHWFPLYGHALFLVPLSGSPRPGDLVRGVDSGATATVERVVYNEREQLRDMISYISTTYPDMPIVTVDRGLDLLGLPPFAPGGRHGR